MEYRAGIVEADNSQIIYASNWTENLEVTQMKHRDNILWLSRNPGINGRAVLQKKYIVIEEM